jgi:hypothetical protein
MGEKRSKLKSNGEKRKKLKLNGGKTKIEVKWVKLIQIGQQFRKKGYVRSVY